MVINKKILLIFISITLITTISSMEKKSDHTTTTEVLSNLLNFETDSLVIARGKTILDNKDYNDKPLLLAVYSYLMTELAICKFSEQKYYTMLVETQAIRISEDVEYIERLLFEQLDDSWKKQKKEILQVNNLKKAKKSSKILLKRVIRSPLAPIKEKMLLLA